jgi:hypothetical protein
MENVMPEFTAEQMNQAVEKKGNEIFDMFFEVVNPQITDAVTQLSPTLGKEIAKACALAHIRPFKSPFESLPKEKLEGLNGAALERLGMVFEFWKGVEAYLQSK